MKARHPNHSQSDILVVGSVALDTVETPFGRVREALGGSASYFSAAASFFARVKLVAVVGTDFPARYLKTINSFVSDLRGFEVKKGKTFRWSGRYDYDLNQAHTLKTSLNLFAAFKPRIPDGYKKVSVAFLANIDPDLQRDVLRQVTMAHLTACDTMNFWIQNKKRSLLNLLKQVDILLINDSEIRLLTGENNLFKASSSLLNHGPRLVVIKKGEHGVICQSKTFKFIAPAYPLETVCDPTGAGDSFAGGFLGYLSSQPSLKPEMVRQAIIYGSVLASYNVESFSLDRLKRLKISDIQKRFRAFRSLTKF